MEVKNEKNLFRGKIVLVFIIVTIFIFISTLFLSTFFININKPWLLNQSHNNLVLLTDIFATEYLSPSDFLHQNFVNKQEKFDIFFQRLLDRSEVNQVNAFNIEGLMISSDPNYKPTKADKERVNMALIQGNIISEEVSITSSEKQMEMYIPVKNKDGVTYGVIEIFHVLDDINIHLDETINTTKIILLGTFSSVALFVFFWSIFFYRNLNKRNRQLIKDQEAFKKSIDLKKLFISIMNHDLKHPLGVIKTASSMLKEQENNPSQTRHIDKIDEMTDSMLQMISDARIFSQLEDKQYAEKKVEMDLNIIVDKIVSDFQNRDYNNKKIRLDFIHSKNSCKINALPILKNVIINLIDNAIKYSGSNPEIEIKITNKKDSCLISISDNGSGVPDKYKQKIFMRYKRLHNKSIEGTGLGLAIAKYITELHNGEIWVEDGKKGGSVFKINLPK